MKRYTLLYIIRSYWENLHKKRNMTNFNPIMMERIKRFEAMMGDKTISDLLHEGEVPLLNDEDVMLIRKKMLIGDLWEMKAFESTDVENFNHVLDKNFTRELFEYHQDEWNAIWGAFIVLDSAWNFVQSKVSTMKDAETVQKAIENGAFGSLNEAYVWSAFNKKPLEKSFFVDEMIDIMKSLN